ncbi:MAG: arginine--tRNA ligase [Alphaproteobacteria bacterium]|nr:arginine--tRNA ligase [Alphaproteobacteria bacterium]
MNIFNTYRDYIEKSIEALIASGALPAGLDTGHVTVEPPRDPGHGDISTNAAMVLARPAKMKPRDIADLVAARLREVEGVDAVEIAGPGFINLRLGNSVWHHCLEAAIGLGKSYGDSDHGGGRRVNVEYVSTNPTGPLHVGHARGAVVGDVLSSLLAKAGYEVTREYYVNDAGAQVDTLARSAHLRYCEALGRDIGEIPDGLYPGDYLKPIGRELADMNGDKWLNAPESEWLAEIRTFTIESMMVLIREDLAALGVHQDVFTSERRLVESGMVEEVLKTLDTMGHIYTGTLEPPKGKTPEDWEPRPQTLFRATAFGDDVDRPLKKSDGSWTYFASDIANHLDKYRRGFTDMIDVWGADHAGYVKRMQAAVKAISAGEAALDVKICQLVRLTDKGEPVKMSKRGGTFVTLRDLVDEVGPEVVRFIMLTRRNDAPLDFDLAAVTAASRDNPVWYVQYASARCHSVRRMAAAAFPNHDMSLSVLARAPISCLTDEAELGLIKAVASWPRLIEAAAEAHEPHRIAFFLYDMAALFHGLWTKGKDDPSLRFVIEEDQELTMARQALVRGVETVIASGLGIFGIEPVEEMR